MPIKKGREYRAFARFLLFHARGKRHIASVVR